MKRKVLFLSLLACFSVGNAVSQQDRAMTHFMFDKMSVNPGVTGMNISNGICATSIYRNQWDKVNGAPNSVVLNVDGNLEQYGVPGGVGISFYHDAIAFTRQNTAVLNYSYHLPIDEVGVLGVGVGLGITNLGMNPTWVPPTQGPDASLPTAFGETKFDANFGLYFKGQDFYLGLSSTHLPLPSFVDDNSAPGTSLVGLTSERHYYLLGGYTYALSSGDELLGDLIVQTDFAQTSFNLSGRYLWQNKFSGGLSYRFSDAVCVLLGANVFELLDSPTNNTLNVGYSYDISVNKLASVSRGTHELMVKYCYMLPPIPVTKSHHPRWL